MLNKIKNFANHAKNAVKEKFSSRLQKNTHAQIHEILDEPQTYDEYFQYVHNTLSRHMQREEKGTLRIIIPTISDWDTNKLDLLLQIMGDIESFHKQGDYSFRIDFEHIQGGPAELIITWDRSKEERDRLQYLNQSLPKIKSDILANIDRFLSQGETKFSLRADASIIEDATTRLREDPQFQGLDITTKDYNGEYRIRVSWGSLEDHSIIADNGNSITILSQSSAIPLPKKSIAIQPFDMSKELYEKLSRKFPAENKDEFKKLS